MNCDSSSAISERVSRPFGSLRLVEIPLALVRLVLGLLLGLSGLIAMARLVAGAFAGGPHLIVWFVTGVVMFGWVVYAGWRARRSRFSGPPVLVVAVLAVIGVAVAWFGTGGPVLALVCSLAGFGVVWWHDRPVRRPRRPIRLQDR